MDLFTITDNQALKGDGSSVITMADVRSPHIYRTHTMMVNKGGLPKPLVVNPIVRPEGKSPPYGRLSREVLALARISLHMIITIIGIRRLGPV